MSLCPKHAKRNTYDATNFGLRFAQCFLALLVAALSGVDLGRWSISGSHADSRWIYAEVVSVLTILTAWSCGFRQHRAQTTVSIAFCVFWQTVLSVLWLVVSAVYGLLAFSDPAAAAELDFTRSAVGIAVVPSSLSTLLWSLDALHGCARCCTKADEEEQGGRRLEEGVLRVVGLEGTEETETGGAQEMKGQRSEALPPYSEVESTVGFGKNIPRVGD